LESKAGADTLLRKVGWSRKVPSTVDRTHFRDDSVFMGDRPGSWSLGDLSVYWARAADGTCLASGRAEVMTYCSGSGSKRDPPVEGGW
jgi:hypothetical protein